jgi:hypothetical protein
MIAERAGKKTPQLSVHADLMRVHSIFQGNYSAHLNPEGRCTREKPFFPQISQMDADLKNIIQICFNL